MGEVYDPFEITDDEGSKAKETWKAKESYSRERSHQAEEGEYDAEVRNLLCLLVPNTICSATLIHENPIFQGSLTMTIFSILKQVLIILLEVLV